MTNAINEQPVNINIASQQAKKLWCDWSLQINKAHYESSEVLHKAKTPSQFLNWMKSNEDQSNHLGLIMHDKIKHYGRVLFGILLFMENDMLYVERCYYPTSKITFRKRIATDLGFEFTRHFIERFIERWDIRSYVEFKAQLWSLILQPTGELAQDLNQGIIDITTKYLFIGRDMMLFADANMEKKKATFITIVSGTEITKSQKEMIDYILNKTGTKNTVITAHELPRCFTEADRILEDTDIRKSYSVEFRTPRKTNGLYHMLKKYDPTF